MTGVVEDARNPALADPRHHVRHHRAQPGPGHDAVGADRGEQRSRPVNQRLDAVLAYVAVYAVELCRSGDAKARNTQPAGNDLGAIIEQADPGRPFLAPLVVEVHGDRIALTG